MIMQQFQVVGVGVPAEGGGEAKPSPLLTRRNRWGSTEAPSPAIPMG